ncbi:MAG: nucleotidyl transferase AbiEii/AbiGii toxin family protein [Rhodospirillales bacterium]|nr:nucleotidyl transferase AbiEii/AbiGii toxin family protein [Rhodospirillales bacterium]
MVVSDSYRRQVALLVRVLPHIEPEKAFALKGGTAINLFIRDMARLSVDIDLAYLPVADRPASLADIDQTMQRIAERIREGVPGAHVHPSTLQEEGVINKLVVRADNVQVKIEITPVLRGCVYDTEVRTVSPSVEDHFGYAEIQVVSFADLYAGKLVAALDRQHPRDLFDVRDLLANEGIDGLLRDAFIVYLISHNRPMAEVLAPTRKEIAEEFARGFEGMTDSPVSLDELLQTREDLIADIVGNMPDEHRKFLLSFKRGEPDWGLLGLPDVEHLPAVKWRQLNLASMDAEKREAFLKDLEAVLFPSEA